MMFTRRLIILFTLLAAFTPLSHGDHADDSLSSIKLIHSG